MLSARITGLKRGDRMNGSAIFKLTRSARKDFILAVIYVAIETLLEVITPVWMADIIDIGVMHRDTSIFVSRGLGMLACAAGSLLFGLLYAKAAARAAATVASQIRQAQFDQIEKFSFENIDRFESSGLITRLTSDVMVLQNTITNGIRPIARGPLMLILGIIMCFIISWKLSIVYLIVRPIRSWLCC